MSDLEKRRLSFKVAGKEIVVRHQLQKAFKVVMGVKDLVSAAVKSDPHAALAWAGVLVILPVNSSMSNVYTLR